MFVISFHTIIYNSYSGVWRNSVREFGAIPFGSLAAKLTILSVFYCNLYVLLLFFKTFPPPVAPSHLRHLRWNALDNAEHLLGVSHIRHALLTISSSHPSKRDNLSRFHFPHLSITVSYAFASYKNQAYTNITIILHNYCPTKQSSSEACFRNSVNPFIRSYAVYFRFSIDSYFRCYAATLLSSVNP